MEKIMSKKAMTLFEIKDVKSAILEDDTLYQRDPFTGRELHCSPLYEIGELEVLVADAVVDTSIQLDGFQVRYLRDYLTLVLEVWDGLEMPEPTPLD